MKVKYNYASPSMCTGNGNKTTLGMSTDLSREKNVSFLGKLKHPLIFRDAMLMLREIVISDTSIKKKEREDFFAWLEGEIERRILVHEQYMPNVRDELTNNMDNLITEIKVKDDEIAKLYKLKNEIKKEIDKHDVWRDYNNLERHFWKFIKDRDYDLWFVLDPVITVHKDIVSFEAFSIDESTYGCLSINMDEFELLKEPELGTTNIDFSHKLAREIERFRTYNEVNLSVNPKGFSVESGIMPEHVEKKIELPDTWIKGFNQVSAAASLGGIDIELTKTDMYDICSFLRRHKEKESPRYMKWILDPGKNVKILFEPFNKILTLESVYNGEKKREEKIWGRRRWLVIEKILPLSNSFKVRLLGFGMPQFIVADMGYMNMTIGFTSWSSNDWVKGTAFNIMGGFIGEGNYSKIYELLKERRELSIDEIVNEFKDDTKSQCKAGIGRLLKKGEGYYDLVNDKVRFRRLIAESLPEEMYETTEKERNVQKHIDEGLDGFTISLNDQGEYVFKHSMKTPNPKKGKWKYYRTPDFDREYDYTDTELRIDEDGSITNVKCDCKEFKKGSRNISEPCEHILALYLISTKFLKVELEHGKVYKINDIMEKLL